MRHQLRIPLLSKPADQRKALLRGLTTQLIREGRKWIDNLLQKENVLYNSVYAENRSAIKWLKTLGFTFVKFNPEYGHMKKPFFEFVRIA